MTTAPHPTSFPEDFLWGVATASHQVEGGNDGNDVWLYENVPGTMYAEPSGDACDHFTRYREDIQLFAFLGVNTYRFSLEWSRIEPAEGEFSESAIAHYRDMLQACHDHGITPVLTYHHFTSPTWLIALGGWESPRTVDLFAQFARRMTAELGDLVEFVCTMNEPNLGDLLSVMGIARRQREDRLGNPTWEGAAAALGITADEVAGFQLSATPETFTVKTAAHHAARDAIKSVKPSMKVGWTLANTDIHAGPGGEENARWTRETVNQRYLRESRNDDFVGIQTYNRLVLGPDGPLPAPDGVPTTSAGEEIWPQAIGATVREAWQVAEVPVLVSENGVETEDDSIRQDFIPSAIEAVKKEMSNGVPVLGYIHWSAMDNFEWIFGYGPKFGLIEVDRITQERTPKPSAHTFGAIARSNGRNLRDA